jgi:hypothetical protein
MQIYIPFAADMKEAVLNRKKHATRRYRRYGNVGDCFVIDGKKFILSNVFRQPLSMMKEQDALEEGFENLEQFFRRWRELHPIRKFDLDDVVWVHKWR